MKKPDENKPEIPDVKKEGEDAEKQSTPKSRVS